MCHVEEWIARAAVSRKGRHPSLLSHLDVVLPPPATCLMYRFVVSVVVHHHYPYRARWRIDRPPYRAHPRQRARDHWFPVFHEHHFDPGEEASPRILEISQDSNEGFVGGGVLHPRNLISYPFYRQTPVDVAVDAHTAHGRASTSQAAEISQGPLRVRSDAHRNFNAEILREVQQRRRVPPASSRHAIHLRPGMVTMRSRQLLLFCG
jgi:hypothetical protein